MRTADAKTNLHVVIEMLKRVPEDKFNMSYFCPRDSECGTACCIAGQIVSTQALGNGWQWHKDYGAVFVNGVNLDEGMQGKFPNKLRAVLEPYFGSVSQEMSSLFWDTYYNKDQAIDRMERLLEAA